MDRPWLRSAAHVATELGADAQRGLSNDEAADRLAQFGPNRLEAAVATPAWRRFLAQFADPLIYLLLVAVVVAFIAWLLDGHHGVPFDVVVIIAIVVLNAVMGYVQEARAEQAVAALQRMSAITARVIRGGIEVRVASDEVVPGDVLVLGEGDAVAADGRLISAASLTVAEASLTGESEAVLKSVDPLIGTVPIGDRVNMVFNGTAVTRGRGRAIVTATGMNTEMGTIASLLSRTETQRTPLQREVGRIGRSLGIAVVVIAAVVMAAILLTSGIDDARELVDVLLIGVSLAVAAVPEGLPAILSVVLALGVQRMARQHAIVRKLSSVEALGSASVVCSDKTGTLTKNEMTIERVVTPSAEVTVTGVGYQPIGELRLGDQPLTDAALLDEVRFVIGGGSLANDAVLRQTQDGWIIQGDPTEAAFLVAEAKIGFTAEREARFERVGEAPFTSERKMMSALATDVEQEGRIAVVTKGAPDVLLTRCSHERVAGVIRPLTQQRRDEVLATVERLADRALRTLAVAYRHLPDDATIDAPEEHEHGLVYLGMVGIIDQPRPEAIVAVDEAQAAGVRVVMITGDHPRTAARIAGDLGIVEPGASVLTGAELEALDDETLRDKLRTVSVFARVAPEHKLRIVAALQADDEVVAMTGDGVNDAPALKSADIGVAMGITGTDVSKEAADMILADDNFATIIVAVREGRAIFANIRRFLRFLLSSNMGEVFTMLFGVVFAGTLGLKTATTSSTDAVIAVPLLATQILWVNLLTDSAPALAIGVDPPPDDIMRRRPRRAGARVIDRSMWIGIVWVGVITAVVTLAALDLGLRGGVLGGTGDIDEGRTMALTTLVFAQLFNAFNARSDRVSAFHRLFTNRLLWGAVGLSAVLQIAVVHVGFLNDAFGTTPLTVREWSICVGLASAVLWGSEAKKLAGQWFNGARRARRDGDDNAR